MALGDQAGLLAVKELNEKTIPALTAALMALVELIDRRLDQDIAEAANEAHALLDRLNGARITTTIAIPERKP